MQQFDTFNAIIHLRSGGEFIPRFDVFKWHGRKVRATALYVLEGRHPYWEGEFACQIDDFNGERFPRGWIASGDLLQI